MCDFLSFHPTFGRKGRKLRDDLVWGGGGNFVRVAKKEREGNETIGLLLPIEASLSARLSLYCPLCLHFAKGTKWIEFPPLCCPKIAFRPQFTWKGVDDFTHEWSWPCLNYLGNVYKFERAWLRFWPQFSLLTHHLEFPSWSFILRSIVCRSRHL